MYQDIKGKVQIIDLYGNVLADIKTDSNGEEIFRHPYC
jgi:S-adenosylmethionine hydrolase